jgi:hypothetical protein
MKLRVNNLAWKAWSVFALTILLCRCKRENSQDCMSDVQTISEVINTKGIIRFLDTPSVYTILIAPQGLDTQRYIPCNLPESFKVSNQGIIVSGLVKYSLDPYFSGDYQPFVITKIGKQD